MLGKCEMALSSKVQDRDMQHQELGQIRRIQAELKDEMNQQRESLHQLTQQITATEQFLNRVRWTCVLPVLSAIVYVYAKHGLIPSLQMRRYFEKAVQERNDLGLQVIERNEEVCVFHEKINVQGELD